MYARLTAIGLLAAVSMAPQAPALADEAGVTAAEIKIGQTGSYSGPASPAVGQVKVQVAYFKMVNDRGGINGRKVDLISVDDGFSPAKSVEQTRKLVEEDRVFLMFGQMGTAAAAASSAYLNAKGIPQLLIGSGASRFADPAKFPWTIGTSASYRGEAVLFGRYIRQKEPSAKVGILYQNDDLGKDYLSGVSAGLGDKAQGFIVARQSLDVTEPTVDSQILNLRAAGADTIVIAAISKPTAQAIRKIGELGWKPQIFVSLAASSIKTVMEPAGLDFSKGIITTTVYKDPSDPRWRTDPEYVEYIDFMNKYMPGFDQTDLYAVSGYIAAQVLEKALTEAGPNPTRGAVKRAMTSLDHFHAKMASPATFFTTSPTDYDMFKSLEFMRFNGKTFEPMNVELD
jgi:ABC-type branched-subunit amino acid transport system substrate-binding protein